MRTSDDKIIVCPHCRDGYLPIPPTGDTQTVCPVCGANYPVYDGVLDLLADGHPFRGLAQVSMETERVVSVYEGRWVRRGPLVKALLGIPFEGEYDLITRAMNLTGGETLLDLACGTGIYSRPLARRLGDGLVVGLDLSLPMLSYASRAARAEGISNLILVHGDALNLPFPENCFDVVNCCGALHLFPDVPAVLGQISRALRPGGRFTAATFRKRGGRLVDWLVRRNRQISGMNAFRPDELESLFAQAGLGNMQIHYAGSMWLILNATKPT